jgi:DNA-binding transcriptional LysR family regulator
MDLNQIRYFLAVADTLNFTEAADKCAVSQPALSKAVRKLEDALGAELFERTSQQVRLTEFGITMRVHFERIDENHRKALDAARASSQRQIQRLDVGVMCTIGPSRFSGFIADFRNTHSLIELTLHDVVPAVIPELLLSGSLDCVFCARAQNHDPRFQAVDLFDEGLVVAFAHGHRFGELNSVSLAEIAGEPYLDRLHCEFRDDFFSFTRASGLVLNVAVRSEREDWILELIHGGLGVCVMPASTPLLDTVSHRPVGDLQNLRKLELVMTKSATVSPALSAFRDAAQAFDWG